jgi:hypothetical protein
MIGQVLASCRISMRGVIRGFDPVATRNVRDFDATGITVLDPWAAVR